MSARKRHLKVCPICGEDFWASRSDKEACSESCRGKLKRKRLAEQRKEDEMLSGLAGLLFRMGAEERETQLQEYSRDGKRMTGKPRPCRCNGSGIYDYDQDGDPFCRLCGGPVREVERNPELAVKAVLAQHHTRSNDRKGHLTADWAAARRGSEVSTPPARPSNLCKVYKGAPFAPAGKVREVRIG